MSVRPPGYYTSWYHFVADLPTSTNINLYDWIVQNSFWNNRGKKLNAMITIKSGTVISASDLTSKRINSNPSVLDCIPAIIIGNEFRYYDRISIWNNGVIVGAYGFKDYTGDGSFVPPDQTSSNGIIITHAVTSVSLTVAAGGGAGGSASGSCPGASGGGGGSGGIETNSSASVTAGTQVEAIGGAKGEDASYKQNNVSLVSATKGGDGGDGECGSRFRTCLGFEFGVCFNWANGWANGKGGTGGSAGTPGGEAGNKGSGDGRKLDRDDCEFRRGGAPGTKGGGDGGKGADFCGGTGAGGGSAGWHDYSYTRKELFGPAINVKHTNVRIYNAGGIIAGGYSNPKIYALYGSRNIENSDIQGIVVPSGSGFSSNPF
jgi:hypothetical protein